MTHKIEKKDQFSTLAIVDQHFSEISLQLIKTWCKEYGNQFLQQTSAGIEWCDETRKAFPFLLTEFSTLCYCYYLEKPGQWQPETVSEVLINIMPRKIIVERTFFIAIVPLLMDFLAWIEAEEGTNHRLTTALQEALLNSENQMLINVRQLEKNQSDTTKSFLSALASNDEQKQQAQEKRHYATQNNEIHTLADIVENLRHWTRDFPKAAVEAAIEQRETITPRLINFLQETLQNYEKLIAQDFSGHVYALFLLASFRETSAFPLAIEIASLPEKALNELLGDVLTEDLHRILASLYNGDLGLLQKLIQNPDLSIWSRNAGLNALLLLLKTGKLSRDWLINYFKTLFDHPAFIDDKQATTFLVNFACDLYPDELYTNIQTAFKRHKVDSWSIDPDDIMEIIKSGKEATLNTEIYANELLTLVDDVITDMEWWDCFEDNNRAWYSKLPVSVTYQRDTPKTGRNETCPCGSGKKYKKCCLTQTIH